MFALPKAAWYEFQSPRSWGGVGLFMSRPSMTPRSTRCFVSIPSEVGRGRARIGALASSAASEK